MIIKCYHPETLKCFDVITQYSSMIWKRKFYDIGSFELHCPKANLKVNDIIKYGNNSGIVMQVKKDLQETSIYGYDLKSLTSFRTIVGNVTKIGSPESIMKDLATELLTLGKRKIDGLLVSPCRQQSGSLTKEITDIVFSKFLNDFGKEHEIGYDITFDEKIMLFDTISPKHKEKSVIFSSKFQNIEEIEYTFDSFNEANVVFFKPSDGEIQEIGEKIGIYRRESITSDDPNIFLEKNSCTESIRATANSKLIYKKDWDLGDFVTVQFNDLVIEKQITEVEEVHETSLTKIVPIFGEEQKNPIRKLMERGI